MKTIIIAFLLLWTQMGLCAILITIPSFQPPPPNEAAKMARYIMRNTAWISVATISTKKSIQDYPFVSLESVSDGPASNSTGIPYMYISFLEPVAQDLEKNNRCSIMASLAELDYCNQNNLDPQDPRCARILITGTAVKIDKNSPEYAFGENALFEKHPSMKTLPKDHDFRVIKVDIAEIALFDSFGGLKYISVKDYFSVNDTIVTEDIILKNVNVIDLTVS